jgi:hypothetical protein
MGLGKQGLLLGLVELHEHVSAAFEHPLDAPVVDVAEVGFAGVVDEDGPLGGGVPLSEHPRDLRRRGRFEDQFLEERGLLLLNSELLLLLLERLGALGPKLLDEFVALPDLLFEVSEDGVDLPVDQVVLAPLEGARVQVGLNLLPGREHGAAFKRVLAGDQGADLLEGIP